MNYNTRKKIIKANLHISIKFFKKILKIKNKKELSKWPEPQNPEYGWRGFCLPKYTKEFKIKLVLEYLSGETGGRERVARDT